MRDGCYLTVKCFKEFLLFGGGMSGISSLGILTGIYHHAILITLSILISYLHIIISE